MIRTITTEERKRILFETLRPENRDFLGSGSSRMVFSVPGHIIEEFDLPTEAVLKLNIGLAGFHQSSVEVQFFEQYENKSLLARIYIQDDLFLIMEYVEPISDYIQDELSYALVDGVLYDEELSDEALPYASFLEEVLALFDFSTADLVQMGYNTNNELVLYDYGYQPDSKLLQCSNTLIDYGQLLDFIYDNNITSIWQIEQYCQEVLIAAAEVDTDPLFWYVDNPFNLFTYGELLFYARCQCSPILVADDIPNLTI